MGAGSSTSAAGRSSGGGIMIRACNGRHVAATRPAEWCRQWPGKVRGGGMASPSGPCKDAEAPFSSGLPERCLLWQTRCVGRPRAVPLARSGRRDAVPGDRPARNRGEWRGDIPNGMPQGTPEGVPAGTAGRSAGGIPAPPTGGASTGGPVFGDADGRPWLSAPWRFPAAAWYGAADRRHGMVPPIGGTGNGAGNCRRGRAAGAIAPAEGGGRQGPAGPCGDAGALFGTASLLAGRYTGGPGRLELPA